MSPATLLSPSTQALDPVSFEPVATGWEVQWQDANGSDSADWFQGVLRRVYGFAQHSHGWDSYGASSIARETIAAAALLVALVHGTDASVVAPFVGPSTEGFIQFEWETGSLNIEVEVQPSGRLEYVVFDNDELVREGAALPEDYPRIASMIANVFGER